MENSSLLDDKRPQVLQELEQPVFQAVAKVAKREGKEIYAIGGYVRDLLLDRPCKDIDFVVLGNGVDTARAVAKELGSPKVSVFKHFGTAMFRYQDLDIEFVGARKESYQRESRKPIVEDGTLQDDQDRRDFTINALAISLNEHNFGHFVDPFDGLADLHRQLLRTPLEPDVTFSDDPLRMMRAIRFATQLGFTIDPECLESIKRNRERLSIVSQERITDELNKIILAKTPSVGFKLLYDTGLLHLFFPDMVALQGIEVRDGKGHKDNFYHTLEVLDNISRNTDKLYLRWSAILHDIAKPPTKRFHHKAGWTFHGHEDKGSRMVSKIFKDLRLPLDAKMKYVQKLVLLHLRPIAITKEEATDSAVRRLMFDAGEDIDDLMTLCQADITSKNEKKVKRYLANYEIVIEKIKLVEEKDRIRNWQPPITGEIIMKTFDLKPCREVGVIKQAIREAIIEGEINNDYDQAFERMLSEGQKLGLQPASSHF